MSLTCPKICVNHSTNAKTSTNILIFLTFHHAGIPPISWADTIVLGAKVSAEQSWVVAKRARLGAGADIETISSAFGADFPLNLGRVDATQPDPAGRFPDANTASPDEIQVTLHSCSTSQDSAEM